MSNMCTSFKPIAKFEVNIPKNVKYAHNIMVLGKNIEYLISQLSFILITKITVRCVYNSN